MDTDPFDTIGNYQFSIRWPETKDFIIPFFKCCEYLRIEFKLAFKRPFWKGELVPVDDVVDILLLSLPKHLS